MKINWGTGIALVYASFAILMIGMVFVSRRYDPGLMQKDYYDLDLNYQARLDKKQNAGALPVQPVVRFDLEGKSVEVTLPAEMSSASGTAKCYRSSTTGEDFTVNIEHNNKLSIPATHLTPGRWHIELDWVSDGKAYFYETTFIVTNA
jgi:hypothetical protein